MYHQAPELSPEYSYKGGLQTVITEKLLQIGPVTRFSVRGLLQWAESHVGLQVGGERGMERLRRRPSSCGEEDEGWAAPVNLPALVQRGDEVLERRVASSPSPQQQKLKDMLVTSFQGFQMKPVIAQALFQCTQDHEEYL